MAKMTNKNKKYRLTENSVEYNDRTLYQIESLKDFIGAYYVVKKGDLGGYIESEDNLNQEDNSWVYGANSRVYNSTVDNSTVENSTVENSRVYNSRVYNSTVDNSTVHNSTVENSRVYNSRVHNSTVDNSTVDNSTVENSRVYNSRVQHNSTVHNSTVDNSTVDNSKVQHNSRVHNSTVDNSKVQHNSRVYNSTVDNSRVYNSTVDKGKLDNYQPISIVGSKGVISRLSTYPDGSIQIGCIKKTSEEWLTDYEQIGKTHGFTEAEIAEYKQYIDFLIKMMNLKN